MGWEPETAILLGCIYLVVIAVFSLLEPRYFWENIYKPKRPRANSKRWNSGWIIEIVKLIFGFINFISPSRFIAWNLIDKGHQRLAYFIIDTWVFLWLATLSLIFFSNIFDFFDLLLIPAGWVVWVAGYRMAELFQSWFSQFVLSGVPQKWQPVDPNRTLVLVFMGYFEIVFAYAILAYNYKESFRGISSLPKAFTYSIGNAITIGSADIQLNSIASYIIFSTQLILVLIFITAVVQQIINYSRSK